MRNHDEESEDRITSSFEDETETLESENKIDDMDRGKEMHEGEEREVNHAKNGSEQDEAFSEDSI